jgi:gliding motility-associated-like protein
MKKLLLFSTLLCWFSSILSAQSNFIRQDSIFARSADCDGGIEICIDSISYDNINNLRYFLNGRQYSASATQCSTRTVHNYSFTDIFRAGERGPWELQNWTARGRSFSGRFSDLQTLLDSMRRWDPLGNWQLDNTSQIIFGFPATRPDSNTYGLQRILGTQRGGLSEVLYNQGVEFSGLRIKVPAGVHEFVVEHVNLNQRDTVTVLAACLQKEIVNRTINVGANTTYCGDLSQLLGNIQSTTNVCARTTTHAVFGTASNACIQFMGITEGVDTACLVVCDRYGFCDTTTLIVTVQPNNIRRHTIRDTITIGLPVRTAMGVVSPNGTITAFENICATNSGTNVRFNVDAMTQTVTYQGLTAGIDTACMRVCVGSVCDTTFLYIEALPQGNNNAMGRRFVVTDTITQGLTRTRMSFNTPTGAITTFENYCPQNSGTNARFTLNTAQQSVTVTGLTVGTDTACLRFCNAAGVCDTTIYIVNTLPIDTTTVGVRGRSITLRDTVSLANSREKCDVLVPTGTVASIVNLCETSSGMNVRFSFTQTRPSCVSFVGIEAGADTVCLKVCNTEGVCDTTTYIITTTTSGGNRRIHNFTDTISRGLTRLKSDLTTPPNPTRIRNICDNLSGQNVDFKIDTVRFTVDYMGISVGKDTACIEICNAAGLCDTTYMSIETVNPQILRGGFKTDSIRVVAQGAVGLYCADSSRVGATFQVALNAPSGLNYSLVQPIMRSASQNSACVSVRGFIPGRDTVIHILVGANGISDTTRLIVIVTTRDTFVTNPRPSVDSIRLSTLERKFYCPDSSELRGSPIVSIASCSIAPFDNTSIAFVQATKCVDLVGLKAGVDTFCLVICNQAGFCDTTTLFVRVTPDTVRPVASTDTVRMIVGDSLTYCRIDTSQIGGRVDTIYNLCPQFSGTNARVSLTTDKCLKINALTTGTDTACIVVCNSTTRLCDTTYVVTVVSPRNATPRPSIDSIRVEVTQTSRYCPDVSELRGSPVTSIAFCSATSFDNATVVLDTASKCARISGTVIGRDTACLVICNAAGVCDTTTLYINIIPLDTLPPRPDTVNVTVRIGQDSLFCVVDTSQIRGNVDTIYQICPGLNGLRAVMIFQPTNSCIKVTGRQVGKDTMCVVVCNRTSMRCDTTVIIANVLDSARSRAILKAINDFDSIQVRGGRVVGRSKAIEVYNNDTLNRTPISIEVITQARKGTATKISFTMGIIKYEIGRGASACGLDSFTYKVCLDSTLCDTAVVRVLVDCVDSLVVFNGISPNGDRKNDELIIQGLHLYPNHTVCVYNRWGNEVFRGSDYKNDWGGTWDGKDLPDGTYFYMIRNEDDKSIIKKGYLFISR